MKKGMMLSEIPFGNFPVFIKNHGFDYFIVDAEHGAFDYSDVGRLIVTARLCGIESIIRLPDNSRRDIVKFLDLGADGLLLPMTNCAKDIEKVVEYAKYIPEGKRGISTMRPHTFYRSVDLVDYMKESNERVKVFAQIETVRGLENAEEIMNTKGVAGVLFGPNDYSSDCNVIGDNEETVLRAIDVLSDKIKKCSSIGGIITSNKKFLNRAKSCSMQMFCVGSELSALNTGIKKIAELCDEVDKA